MDPRHLRIPLLVLLLLWLSGAPPIAAGGTAARIAPVPGDEKGAEATPVIGPAGLWLARGLGVVRLADLSDGSSSGTFSGSIDAARPRPGQLSVRPLGEGFAGTWSTADRGGFLWFLLLEQGTVASGWISTVKAGASGAAEPGHRTDFIWHRLSVSEPVERIGQGDLRIEVYADREAFIARLEGAVRGVGFDDINVKKRHDPTPFPANRYTASHGLLIEGQAGQFASRGFGYPANYRPTSKPNMYAPGPPITRDLLAPLRDRLQLDREGMLARFEKAKSAVRRLEHELETTALVGVESPDGPPARPAATADPIPGGNHASELAQRRRRLARSELTRLLASLRGLDQQIAALSPARSGARPRGQGRDEIPGVDRKTRGGHSTTLAFRSASQRAAVAGFGAAFIDADYPYLAPCRIALFAADGEKIGEVGGFAGPDGRGIFRGLVVIGRDGRPSPVIARVRITNGQEWPGYGAGEGVALDDFTYGIPRPIDGSPD